jgi:hypothetical protein
MDSGVAELLLKNMSRNSVEDSGKIARGVEDIPVRKMMEQAQYIENDLLPRLEKSRKKTDADYIFFRGIYKSLLWCIVMAERSEYLQRAIAKEKLLREFYQGRGEELERELLKYITVEDLYLSGALDSIAAGITKRATELLTKK